MEALHYAALLVITCTLVQHVASCDQTEFLHPNGTCVACPVCGPGEQLSEDCGFGDGGEGVCLVCDEGKFSTDTSVSPCTRCTQCNLLNRQETRACSAISDALCGQCLKGYYELRSMAGEADLPCVPCQTRGAIHRQCLPLTAQRSEAEIAVTTSKGTVKEPKEQMANEETFSLILISSATALLVFLIALLLWASLLTAERFKQVPEYCPGPEGLLPATDTQDSPSKTHSQTSAPTDDPQRSLNIIGHEELPPTSIVINVTTNIKPSGQNQESIPQEEQGRSCYSIEEMEQKLQKIWDVAQGQSIEMLEYDAVQDLSLLLDSVDNRNTLRRLGRSLGVPPQVIFHLQGFQDLFQYLRTSTYTLLPQLAQAAALLPSPDVVARIHRAVVNE